METIRDYGFNVQFHPTFMAKTDASDLYTALLPLFAGDKRAVTRRTSRTFGDPGLKYVINWYGTTTTREAVEWTPELLKVKSDLENVTGDKYNVCVIQWYPNGRAFIAPHKDREMTRGTTIAGLSLGQTRTLALSRGTKVHKFGLLSGSLYILNPPTNDSWAHSIEKDESTRPRISLTFRNYVE